LGSLRQPIRDDIEEFLRTSQDDYDRVTLATPDLERTRLEKAFEAFRLAEVALSNRPIQELVKPSGVLFAPLGLKLHYPTFSGTDLEDGEVANSTFACIRLLARKGLNNACWYDQYCRREQFPQTSDGKQQPPPQTEYSAELSACLLEFSYWCEQQPVIILFGRHVQKRGKRDENLERLIILNPPIELLLLREGAKIVRIAVTAPHPQVALLAVNGRILEASDVVRRMDRSINAAVALCPKGIDDNEIDPTYFERLMAYISPEQIDDLSNRVPRKAMVEGLQLEKWADRTIQYEDIDPSILRWLKEEASLEDPKASIQADAQRDRVSCLQIVQRMMTKKGNDQRNDNLHKKREKSTVSFERSIQRRSEPLMTQCEVCGIESTDPKPMFGTEEPIKGAYIARVTKACPNGCCKFQANGMTKAKTPRSINLVPVDHAITFVTQLRLRRLVQRAKKAELSQDGAVAPRVNRDCVERFYIPFLTVSSHELNYTHLQVVRWACHHITPTVNSYIVSQSHPMLDL
jgi:hypothetical protein